MKCLVMNPNTHFWIFGAVIMIGAGGQFLAVMLDFPIWAEKLFLSVLYSGLTLFLVSLFSMYIIEVIK